MKLLSGAELAGYIKENQAQTVRRLKAQGIQPKLAILRNNDIPVIAKYVSLKQAYGDDIGVTVEDWLREDLTAAIMEANGAANVHGVIVQLPLKDPAQTQQLVSQISWQKDVDGLATPIVDDGDEHYFVSATATAINWLLAGYDIDLKNRRIALVGRGRLVGAPLAKMWQDSGYDVTTFGHDSDLADLVNYDVIVSATGVPHLIKNSMVKPGAIVVDAGTASEGGVLTGDVDDEVRERKDLTAITPKLGGVGPLTVTTLFEHTLIAAERLGSKK